MRKTKILFCLILIFGCLIIIDSAFAIENTTAIQNQENTPKTIQSVESNDNISSPNYKTISQNIIINDGKLHEYENTIFEDCHSELGGAIRLVKGELILKNCIFKNNYAYGHSTMGGGAIFINKNCTAIITNCTFTNNRADNGNGGALCIYGNNVKITNCEFTSNVENRNTTTLKGFGGAIYWDGINGELSHSTFTSNVAKSFAGAVDVSRNAINFKVDNCVFSYNKALENDGGAISWGGRGGIITNSKFIKNSANEEGGAIESYTTTPNITTVKIDNCLFDSNNAQKAGGAIYSGHSSYTINNCVFKNNVAGTTGGAIYDENELFVKNSVFKSNKASWGGCIYSKAYLESTHNQFNNNYATICGAGIYVYQGTSKITKSTFNSNTAKIHGGAIFIASGSVTSKGNKFSKNSANSVGGGIYLYSGDLSLSNSVFKYNHAKNHAGSLYIEEKGTCHSTNNIYAGNYAKNCGGSVYSAGKFITKNDQFKSNHASYGGAVYSRGTLKSANNFYAGNKATYGGGVYVYKKSFTSAFDVYYKNHAITGGGISVQKNGKAKVSASCIIKNSASRHYPAINSNGKTKAQNNWWGHTSTSKKSLKKLTDVKVSRWLVLKLHSSKSGKKYYVTVDLRFNQKNKKVVKSLYPLKVKFHKKYGKIKNGKLKKGVLKAVFKKTSNKKASVTAEVLSIKSKIFIK
ncbi:MAG: hypothetical protein IKF11_06580 [Methanobrevibacter sp.]|nr:hypothetical protein [Methanobrevibacter sp.]